MVRLVTALLAAVALHAGAAEISLEGGKCYFSGGGAFYQTDSHHDNYLAPRCASIAWADKFAKGSALGYRVAYIVTQDLEARDNDAVMNDFSLRGGACAPPNYDGCRAVINGQGHMRGVSFSGTADLRLGPVTAVGEYGLLFFKSQFKATIRPVDFTGPTAEVNEESHWTDPPIPLLGATLRYRDVYLSLRHYWPAEHRALSITNHAFTQVMLGVVLFDTSKW